jgi:hypothetical protein
VIGNDVVLKEKLVAGLLGALCVLGVFARNLSVAGDIYGNLQTALVIG